LSSVFSTTAIAANNKFPLFRRSSQQLLFIHTVWLDRLTPHTIPFLYELKMKRYKTPPFSSCNTQDSLD
jgi:hypothetical protein